ncbi:UNVERIFIED_CONTAM: hypothetical protein Sradi_6072800 [Sesamum radiatum]|uniref:Uncharacterized protein n=1 Tax=Sesamum radiatum TaxID=300843 RepID=A0AAW2KHR5_SESRA
MHLLETLYLNPNNIKDFTTPAEARFLPPFLKDMENSLIASEKCGHPGGQRDSESKPQELLYAICNRTS